ncbi:MAG: cation-translocating P-type ATPase [Cardiobacteriaceae bacterium]|nr:cation-translocating P-type ATPase [Cardiobacteriaceae bacterium]
MIIELYISGMRCQACATRIEKVLNKNPNIKQAEVNLISNKVRIDFQNTKLNTDEIIKLIEKTGFQAYSQDYSVKNNPLSTVKIIILLLITMPFLTAMIAMLFSWHQLMLSLPLQFFLSTIAQFFAIPFYKSAWKSLCNKSANMDTLIVLGTTIIYIYSVILFFSGKTEVYFEASVMILCFVSIGKYIEEKTKYQSLNSLSQLEKLNTEEIEVLRNNSWIRSNIQNLKINDIVRAKHGERIAADGILIKGNIFCQEDFINGEYLAQEKCVNSPVYCGATVISGSGEYQVTKTGKETVIADIIQAISQAQSGKAEIARIADKIAAIFIPSVLFFSTLTAIFSYLITNNLSQAINNAVAVLVISCPCAMGLATPSAIVVAMQIAVKMGIRFKNAQILELVGKTELIAFDKTGTLTQGKPEIIDFILLNSQYCQEEIIALCAAIESSSNHPLAQTICDYQKEKNIPLIDFEINNLQNIPGCGLECEIAKYGKIKIGNLTWTEIDFKNKKQATLVGININHKPAAIIILQDCIKNGTKKAVKELHKLNISSLIISGDNKKSVEFIANELKIKEFYAETLPQDKLNLIKKMKEKYKFVAFVGDGLNDAPAIAESNIGFAFINGSRGSCDAADVILLNYNKEANIGQVSNAIIISKLTIKTIKQNLFFSLIYNLTAIPLAACGYLSPSIAAIAMSCSSLSVIFNSLRLKTRVKKHLLHNL